MNHNLYNWLLIPSLLCFVFLNSGKLLSQELVNELEVCPLNTVNFIQPSDPRASSAQWDFCTGDLLGTPSANLIEDFINDESTSFDDAARPEGFELVYSEGEWFGFITNRIGFSLIRADFGNSLENIPVFNNVFIGLSGLMEIKFIQENGQWYALAANINGNLTRLSFGSDIRNIPNAQNLPDVNNIMVSNFGLDLLKDSNGNLVAFSPNSGGSRTLIIINFGNSISNTPGASDYLQTPSSIGRTLDVSVVRDGDEYYGIATGGNNIRFLDFGMNLFSVPTVTSIGPNIAGFIGSFNYASNQIVKDGKNFFAYMIMGQGGFSRLNFGESMNNLSPEYTNFGDYGILGRAGGAGFAALSFGMGLDASNWYGFAINRLPSNVPPSNVNQLIRFSFPNNCNSLPSGSSQEDNPQRQFLAQAAGQNYINLRTFDEDGNLLEVYLDSIRVIPAVTGAFSVLNQAECSDALVLALGSIGSCSNETAIFTNLSEGLDENVNSWEWDFGDGVTSNERDPSHSYPGPGQYTVSLTVNNLNSSCTNTVTQELRVSERPTANFRVSSIDCETGKVIFEDLSRVSANDQAFGAFLTRRTWDFGDIRFDAGRNDLGRNDFIIRGEQEASEEGQDQLLPAFNPGQRYEVSLSVNDDVCCAAEITKTISLIPDDLVAAFSAEAACLGAPFQFTDMSNLASELGGQIDTWEWTFESPSGNISTSFVQNPIQTFNESGMYIVSLRVSSELTCPKTITQNVMVTESAISSFNIEENIGLAPFNVRFENTSSAEALTYLWQFGDGFESNEQNPVYTYENPGTYTVSLQAFNANGCGTLFTQVITVQDDPTALEPLAELGLRIYPNPNQGLFFLENKSPKNQAIELRVLDSMGKELYRKSFAPTIQKEELRLEFLPKGLYLIEIQSGTRRFQQKMIKY